MLYCQSGDAESRKKAIECFEALAEKNYPEAYYRLGRIFFESDKKNECMYGYSWIKRASDIGCSDALCFLGEIYETGNVVPKDLNTAKEYYLKAKKLNHAEATYRLGLIYKAQRQIANVRQDPVDPDRATACFEKARILQHNRAWFELGLIYRRLDANIAKLYFSEFNSRYRNVYLKDHDASQYELGLIYQKEGDVKKAIECFGSAADLGHEWARQALIPLISKLLITK